MIDFKICPGPIHCEGCAGSGKLRALRAERDKWMADHARQYSIAAAYAEERDALRSRVAELERLGNAMASELADFDTLSSAEEAWRRAVRG